MFTKHYGQHAGWYVLLFAILCFSLVRAFGVGGWYPWLHEIVARDNIADYFNSETILVQITNILMAVLISQVLAHSSGSSSFYLIYGAGVGIGLFSVGMLFFMHGGWKIPALAGNERSYDAFFKAFANGIPPILAGQLIEHFGVVGFRLCFTIFIFLGVAVSFFLKNLPEEGVLPDSPYLEVLVRPLQPVRWMGRLVWLSLGFSERPEARFKDSAQKEAGKGK